MTFGEQNSASTPQGRSLPEPAVGYRSGMLRRFGILYYLSGLGWFMRHLRLEEHSSDNIRRASEFGPVVYVLHTRSIIDWLALNRVLNSRKLPVAAFTTGLRSTIFQPLMQGIKELVAAIRYRMQGHRQKDPLQSGWYADAVSGGLTTALFLVHPKATRWGRRREPPPDPVAALLKAQAQSPRPIQLIPVVVAWSRGPESQRTVVGRFLMGSQDEPGPLQKLYSVATRTGGGLVQTGEAVNLVELLERTKDAPIGRQVRATRILLRRYLYRESHLIRGPRIRPYRWMRRLVLNSPEVRAFIKEEVQTKRRSDEATIQRKVTKTLDRTSARFSFPMVQIANQFCHFLFNRIFAGLDVSSEDIEKIRTAFRSGTVILVPCHRSHLDYLLFSHLLFSHDVMVPHIVAGENLSFWPLGPLLRRCGAFFVKRKIGGDRMFRVVFERYLLQLVRDGYPIEFFIEGGRSRTGKLLPAKLGVLSMVLDAAKGGREDRTTTFLPIAISYEQIAEEAAYARELKGEKKQKEDIGQVVRAGRVFRKRFGRVFLRVGETLSANDVFNSVPGPWDQLDREHRAEALHRTGEHLMFQIAKHMVVLPSGLVAMALLSQSKRGIRIQELNERVSRFHLLLEQLQAPFAYRKNPGQSVTEVALARFETAKMVHRHPDEMGDILQVIDDRRITLEYYKNGLIHFLAPLSLMASAVRTQRSEKTLDTDVLLRIFRKQVFLLRYEFTLDPNITIEQMQQQSLKRLVAYGGLARTSEEGEGDVQYKIASPQRLSELGELTRNFIESYYLVLRGSKTLRADDIRVKDLPARLKKVGEGLLAVDEITRPESLSIVNLTNAVRAFREEGVLQFRAGGGGMQFEEEIWQQYSDDLRQLLD